MRLMEIGWVSQGALSLRALSLLGLVAWGGRALASAMLAEHLGMQRQSRCSANYDAVGCGV